MPKKGDGEGEISISDGIFKSCLLKKYPTIGQVPPETNSAFYLGGYS